MIETGILFGLASAFAFGVTDTTATVVSRRAGTVFAAAGIQTTLVVTFSILLLATGVRLPDDPLLVARVALVGGLTGTAYLATYQAFRLGPVTVTGPIVATFGGLTAVFAVLALGERPSLVQGFGVVAAAAGLALLGVALDGEFGRVRLVSPGVLFALVAAVMWAAAAVISTPPIREAGWLPVAGVSRIFGGLTLWSILGLAATFRWVRRTRGPTTRTMMSDGRIKGGALDVRRRLGALDAPALLLVAFMGIVETIGFSAMSAGLERSDAWLVGIVSSFGPGVTVLFGLAVLRERLRRIQWVGLALVFGSIVLVGMP